MEPIITGQSSIALTHHDSFLFPHHSHEFLSLPPFSMFDQFQSGMDIHLKFN
jgi:hypothetical protein